MYKRIIIHYNQNNYLITIYLKQLHQYLKMYNIQKIIHIYITVHYLEFQRLVIIPEGSIHYYPRMTNVIIFHQTNQT
ncbi:hypothetical protein PFHG_05422 [Plasmodium falciparum HB3]|uniref:Uncharacterized protein n=1 Tax=Plasmodium falciparum (isolate HB3) TaxID=137071 RepID=A0A0L7KL00_PLAFX|nr:hypothetical protein PFHG_05422 [Plasmodium falciparum HB3]